jgi:serine phosphatase RsbU (regulator of sigma subunit)
MEIVVRYEPAVEAAQVGGDWYDAFLQRQGDTMIVIGDVVGHDAAAAAAMGQVRGLLRGIAATTGEGPAAVLSRLDQAMDLLQIDTTATAVVARVEQTADERQRGVTRLRWSNAGHPPPMVLSSEGSVALLADLAGFDADLLLGIDPAAARSETEIVLDRDATVLLYTDGLVERRGQSVDDGLRKLHDVLAELAGLTLDELCDRVLDRMLPAEPEDDVAMVAIRLHRQDQPRPLVAGPERIPPAVANDE